MSGRSFLEGLLTPTVPGLGLAAVVAVLTAAGVALAPLDRALADDRAVLRWDDEFGALAGRLVRQEGERSPAPLVWVVGSSAVREALVDEAFVAQAVQQRGYTGAQVLAAGGLVAQEALSVVDALPLQAGDLVVAEVSERNLGRSLQSTEALLQAPRLPVRSPALDALALSQGLAPTPRRGGSDWLTFSAFWAPRTAALVLPPLASGVDFHLVDRLSQPTPEALEHLTGRVAGWTERCAMKHAENHAAYAQIKSLVDQAGARLVLVRAPRNASLLAAVRESPGWAACQEAHRSLATDLQTALVDPTSAVSSPARAFRDHAHLVDAEARMRWTTAFVAALPGVDP